MNEEKEHYKQKTVKISVEEFEIKDYKEILSPMNNCLHCKLRAICFTNSGDGICENHVDLYDYCPYCDTLYDKGTMNYAKCNYCELAE